MGDRVILHSDINCCYASIEHLHHPELAGSMRYMQNIRTDSNHMGLMSAGLM